MKKQLRKKLKGLVAGVRNRSPHVQIGKKGLTESIFKEINDQLDQNELIKIKFLKNFITDTQEAAIEKILRLTKSQKVEERGRTVIIIVKK
jgi:RNA-binding protein YhbY